MPEKQSLRAASYLYLEKEGKVLLMKRQNTGFRDGYWSLVAGHVDIDEDYQKAMVRETKEEVGIAVSQDDLEPFVVMHRDSDESPYVDLFFRVTEWEGEIENMEPEKCEKIEWFQKDELPEKTISYVRKVIQEGTDKLDYMEYGWS